MIRRNLVLAFAALASAAGLSACGGGSGPGAGGQEVVFSILATENSQNQQALWEPFLSDMEKQTGLNITPRFASNYTSLIEAMRFNQIQVGWFSNQSGLEAVRRAGGEVFVRSSDPTGVDGYNSVIIVPANSTLTAEDLAKCGKRHAFGLGDAKSTSGTLAPTTYFFAPRKIDPQTCFRTLRSANHEANLLSVANGLLDAATNNSTMIGLRPEQAAKIKIIWTSPRIPEDPIVWRKDLDPAVKEKLRSFFLTYGTAEGAEGERQREILKKLSFGTFKPADDTHLIPVREMEATEKLLTAQNAGDASAAAEAQKALDAVRAERIALERRAAPAS